MSAINVLKRKDRPLRPLKLEDIPTAFKCPITKKVMGDPVMAFDGHCYERKAIEDYLESHQKSPVTGKEADFAIVFPNHRLREEIEVFLKGEGRERGKVSAMAQFLNQSETDEGVIDTQ